MSVADWVINGHSSLSETRDLREAQTLSTVLDHVNRGDLSEALDTIVMRLHALAAAKVKGGSWEKASRLELIAPPGGELLPASLSGMAS